MISHLFSYTEGDPLSLSKRSGSDSQEGNWKALGPVRKTRDRGQFKTDPCSKKAESLGHLTLPSLAWKPTFPSIGKAKAALALLPFLDPLEDSGIGFLCLPLSYRGYYL